MKKFLITLIAIGIYALILTECICIVTEEGDKAMRENGAAAYTAAYSAPLPETGTSNEPDYEYIERIVQAEAGGEPYAGQVAVAQCIKNAMDKLSLTEREVIEKLKYAQPCASEDVSHSVRSAVHGVFIDGLTATDAEIMYFYAPARVSSSWHESKAFACEIGGHRFFTEDDACDVQ